MELILSEEDSDRACIVDVGDTGRSYVIPWSSIPQELQQPLRRYVAQADGKLWAIAMKISAIPKTDG